MLFLHASLFHWRASPKAMYDIGLWLTTKLATIRGGKCPSLWWSAATQVAPVLMYCMVLVCVGVGWCLVVYRRTSASMLLTWPMYVLCCCARWKRARLAMPSVRGLRCCQGTACKLKGVSCGADMLPSVSMVAPVCAKLVRRCPMGPSCGLPSYCEPMVIRVPFLPAR